MKVPFPFRSFVQLKNLYITIDFFYLVILILIFYILFILIQKNRKFNKRTAISKILEPWLIEVILEEGISNNTIFSVPDDIKQLLRKKTGKEVLLKELITLKKSLSGVPGTNMQKLYEQLHLDVLSRQRLRSKKWHIKAKGIQELAMMNQHADSSLILSLTNHTNAMVRMEAQTAIVRLKKYKGLNFFNMLSYPLTEWHQMNLLHLLSDQPVTTIHSIKMWLQSSNATVVQFALKLIGEQHAEEFCDEVINCLEDFDINVRRCAILCLGELLSHAATEALKKHFDTEENKELQLCIINQLKKTGADSEFQFFLNLQLSKDAEIKLASHNTILHFLKNKESFAAA